MAHLFGTDGVRGLANGSLTALLALQLSQAAAYVFTHGRMSQQRRAQGFRPSALLARDPRISGDFLAAAVAAGLASSGVDVYDAGVIPTPAAAYLIADRDLDFGVVVSASHNPAQDNGIKIFAAKGLKLPDAVEERIEERIEKTKLTPTGGEVGRILRFADAEDRYVVHLLSTLTHSFKGIHVVLDCAHGAASGISPRVFSDAGARVSVMGNDPNGLNINEGVGSTHVSGLARRVVELGADIGIAHDGDADRCLAVDAEGNIVDGDRIMAILATSMKHRGMLHQDTLVATVMSNLGLRRAMEQQGIAMVETAVGDRYVLEKMTTQGYSLGGEQSGHIIMNEFCSTGDGVLTGLHLVNEMVRAQKSLKELASVMEVYPQVMINVPHEDHRNVSNHVDVLKEIARAENELVDSGRVLLRPSGTENIVRVMVEASDENTAIRLAQSLADVVAQSHLPKPYLPL